MKPRSRPGPLRFYLLSLGCPKNEVDAEGMARLLQQAGHLLSDDPAQAQVLIVNTCGFIDQARQESITALRTLSAAKRPDQLLVAAGCLSQRYGRKLARLVPGLDGLIGTRRWAEIVPLIRRLTNQRTRQPPALLDDPPAGTVVDLPRSTTGPSAYLKIAEGCSASCAFCAIPAIKGQARSRPAEAIVAEARQLVAQGSREIILIAQDTTAYGREWGQHDGLAALIVAILEAAPGLDWLRLMYAYPQHVSLRLIEVMARYPQVCHYLDLPLQHSHPHVLRRMNRPANVDAVRQLVSELRRAMPDIALRTSFIVGYPGETEEEFQALLDFVQEMAFDKVGVFTYSREQGTPAAALPGQLPAEIKEERYRRLMELQQSLSLAKNQEMIGRVLDVLVEGCGDGFSLGRSYRDAPEIDGLVMVSGELPVGEIVPVRITGALEYDLIGEI